MSTSNFHSNQKVVNEIDISKYTGQNEYNRRSYLILNQKTDVMSGKQIDCNTYTYVFEYNIKEVFNVELTMHMRERKQIDSDE